MPLPGIISGIRALAVVRLHDIVPKNPTVYGAYRALKGLIGTYDYRTQLSDVSHAVQVFRKDEDAQSYDFAKYLPKRLIVETDRVHGRGYRMIYRATYRNTDTGESYDRMGSMYAPSQLLPSEISEELNLAIWLKGVRYPWAVIDVERISVWHQPGDPYAKGRTWTQEMSEGAILSEI